ncbi:response regulator transcription factor [Paenibacillus sp. GCM10027626]|uniref:response regulator transcription factor n=1 Tax=Paenibacillus sp. GCM10027626 TaxID=3273411 RepID=UPI00362CDA2D
MRILLLEDEEAIRGFVRINLKRNGMDVTEAEDGETALALAAAANPPFDVALLDVMLPTISGFEVCGQLRQRFPRMGIIMLTAKSQEEDKIRGLELGADDYVQKPFSPGELIARMRSLHRRMMPGGLSWPEEASSAAENGEAKPDSADESTKVPQTEQKGGSEAAPAPDGDLTEGPFRLSATERRLWKGQDEIILTPTEWTLVKLLIERAGEGLSRDDILDAVWGRHFIGDLKIVDVNIRRIRQKLEDEPSDPQFIETLWGYGYRWKRSDRR